MPPSQRRPAVFLLDTSFRFVFANHAAEILTGYTTAQLYRMTLRDTYHPDDLALGEERMRQVSLGQPVSFERRLRRADRSYVQVKVSWRRAEGDRYRLEMELVEPPAA
jgi:PAS domain S-box-containing protein